MNLKILKINKFFKPGLILFCLILIIALLIPHTIKASTPQDDLEMDALIYVRDTGVTLEEALHRFELQKAAGELNAELTVKEPDTFAGLWIEHEPDFKIVVGFTRNGEKTLEPYLSNELRKVVEVRKAEESLSNLEKMQTEALAALREAEIPVDSSINLFDNCVEVIMPEVVLVNNNLARGKLDLPDKVVLIPRKTLALPAADIFGGISMEGLAGGSTAGFTVVDEKGVRGITTCAHTDRVLFYLRYNVPFRLPFKEARMDTHYDVQWHTCGNFNVRNEITIGLKERRTITGSVARQNQVVGAFVAKYGKNTGYNAGYIHRTNVTLDYIKDCKPTFVQVNHSKVFARICDTGDSGGPWFLGNDAFGTTCAKDNNGDGYYMPVEFFEGVGIKLLTEP